MAGNRRNPFGQSKTPYPAGFLRGLMFARFSICAAMRQIRELCYLGHMEDRAGIYGTIAKDVCFIAAR